MAAEMPIRTLTCIWYSLASMGPQLIGCGDEVGLDFSERLGVASMGPQLIGCGDCYHVRYG